jgi:hypothetical protein
MVVQDTMLVGILYNKLMQWYAWMVGEAVAGEDINTLMANKEHFGLPVSGL